MREKVCSHCLNLWPATLKYFSRHKHTKDGFQFWCKACMSEAMHNWRLSLRNVKVS